MKTTLVCDLKIEDFKIGMLVSSSEEEGSIVSIDKEFDSITIEWKDRVYPNNHENVYVAFSRYEIVIPKPPLRDLTQEETDLLTELYNRMESRINFKVKHCTLEEFLEFHKENAVIGKSPIKSDMHPDTFVAFLKYAIQVIKNANCEY